MAPGGNPYAITLFIWTILLISFLGLPEGRGPGDPPGQKARLSLSPFPPDEFPEKDGKPSCILWI